MIRPVMNNIPNPIPIQIPIPLKNLNNMIQEQICYDTINKLKDEALLEEYKKCKSVNSQITILSDILEKNNIPLEKQTSIISDYMVNLIPAGTKGNIRGNKFNKIIEDYIRNIGLDSERYDIQFEKICNTCVTPEIPDWFILEKTTGKVIVGMNQIDLWSGGHQINRGSKYLINNKYNTETSKLVCVICSNIQFTSQKNKAYNLFNTGFSNNTLTYLKNLKNIIDSFFQK